MIEFEDSPALRSLEGELLGDGCLLLGRRYKNACFQIQSAYHGQVRAAVDDISQIVKFGTGPHKFSRVNSFTGKFHSMWQLRSRRSRFLTKLYSRWYTDGKKSVPSDFRLTKESALHWYIGDGSLHKTYGFIILCTDNFDNDSIFHLLMELKRTGFDATLAKSSKGYPRIRLNRENASRFLSWIGPCPVPELIHKWALKENTSA